MGYNQPTVRGGKMSGIKSMFAQKRRIALVTHTLNGGVWSATRSLFEALQNSEQYSMDIIVLATSSSDESSVRLRSPRTWCQGARLGFGEHDGLPYTRVGASFVEFEFQRYQPRKALTDLLNGYDLVQIIAGTPAWASVAKSVSTPVCLWIATTVVNERTTLLNGRSGWRQLWLLWMTYLNACMERDALGCVDRVFVASSYTRRQVRSIVQESILSIGPLGVDTQFFIPGCAPGNDGYILAVGRLNDIRKNWRLLLAAYLRVRKALPNAPRLALAGHNVLPAAERAYIASSGLADFVDIHANITIEQLRNLYQNATLFVLSSNEEGLGIVILEAMACGLAVVATRCGGPEDLVVHDETGLLTPVGDVNVLAEAMAELLSRPDLARQMGEAGRARAETMYSYQAVGRVYLDKYHELLADGAS